MTAIRDPAYIWLNGDLIPWEDARVHVTALGTAAMTSCFEGIRGYWNEDHRKLYVFRLLDHLQRLQKSMKILRMGLTYSNTELSEGALELVRMCEWQQDIYITVLAFYGSDTPGQFVWSEPASILIKATPRGSRLGSDTGINLSVSSWRRISDDVMPPRVKAIANYLNSRFAHIQARIDGYDDVILLDRQGKVTEAAGACLFIVRDGQPITPPVTGGILESITRQTLIELLNRTQPRNVIERAIDRTELYIADEVLLCGTGGSEVTPILSVDRYPVGSETIGSLTQAVENLYHDIVRGRTKDYREWRTAVS